MDYSLNLSPSLPLPLSLTLPLTRSGYLPFHRGPCVTLFIVLFGWLWRTMAVWSLGWHSACVNLHLSIGSAVLRCQERLCDLCVTEGGFHRWEPQGERFALCERTCARTRPMEFYRGERVKTTHCVCFNVSSWLSLQGCHSQVASHSETAGPTRNQFFFYTFALKGEGGVLLSQRIRECLRVNEWFHSIAEPPPIKPF